MGGGELSDAMLLMLMVLNMMMKIVMEIVMEMEMVLKEGDGNPTPCLVSVGFRLSSQEIRIHIATSQLAGLLYTLYLYSTVHRGKIF